MKTNSLSVKYKDYPNLNGENQTLVQQVGDGSIIKRFDKTPLPIEPQDVVCPHFVELKWAYGCPYKCSWCYLQGTLRFMPFKTKPKVKNYEKIRYHLERFFNETVNNDYSPELLNTGEIADSLMWESNGTPFSRFINSIAEKQNKHKILFLSKSDYVDNLLKLKTDSIVPSFTLNAYSVASRWERGAPDVKRRIKAAKRLSQAGYKVRIRIDPMVPILNWEKEYKQLIEDIFSSFVPERITLGSLRGLISTINNSNDKSWCVFLSESSGWGKKIDFQSRKNMYKTMSEYIQDNLQYHDIALCKETREMWKELSMNFTRIRCNCIW